MNSFMDFYTMACRVLAAFVLCLQRALGTVPSSQLLLFPVVSDCDVAVRLCRHAPLPPSTIAYLPTSLSV